MGLAATGPDETPQEAPLRFLLTAVLADRGWDIHWTTADALAAELEAAGLTYLRTVPHERGTPFVALRLEA